MKTIKLQDINPNIYLIETKIKGDKWLETDRASFTGNRIKMFGDNCVSFIQHRDNGKVNSIICDKLVSARVRIWNKETMQEDLYKILF